MRLKFENFDFLRDCQHMPNLQKVATPHGFCQPICENISNTGQVVILDIQQIIKTLMALTSIGPGSDKEQRYTFPLFHFRGKFGSPKKPRYSQ
jgi:hypothetical protein